MTIVGGDRVRSEILRALVVAPSGRTSALSKRPGPREVALPLVREPIRMDQAQPDVFPL